MNNTPPIFLLNEYSIIYLLLPFGLLLPIVGLVYIKICSQITNRIANKLLRFNIVGIIGLILAAIIYSLLVSIITGIKSSWESFRLLELFGISIFTFLLIGLPTINVFRFIELQIDSKIEDISLRIVLNFFTTCMIPFFAFFSMYYYWWGGHWRATEFLDLFYLFVGGLIIASFRSIYNYNIHKEKELIRTNESKLAILKELKIRAELNSLHSRINPHFLYNSLNSIAGLAHEDADKTEHMALSLSKLFRYSINKDQSDWTTFKEEMEMVRIYLDVEKVRFDDRLNYSVELPKELEDYKIPRFMIQPLVENAVKHGISKSVKSGQIKVAVTKEGKKLFIAVLDDGPDFPNDLAPGFGIQSIYDKLEILYKDKFEMNFINSPQKQVLIKLN